MTTLYGPAASGKTTACLLATIACAERGKKIIFVDTENGFSVERLQQLTPNYRKVLDNLILLHVNSFEEQVKLFKQLREMTKNPNIGLVVVDTIGCHYRTARSKDVNNVNNELVFQMDTLRALYKQSDAIILITNQVYADLDSKEGFKGVGGKITSKRSKCMVQLKLLMKSKKMAILEKFPGLKEEKRVIFEIREKGFFKV